MTPGAVVRRAREAGLDMIGICDHNTGGNAAAVVRAGARAGLVVLPGMEVTSREEVHLLGLFAHEEELMNLHRIVQENLPGENDEETFGPQVLVDEEDRILGISTKLLIGATELSVEEIVDLIHRFGGLAIASHVDRPSFSLVGQLGLIPEGLALDAVEVSAAGRGLTWDPYPTVTSSDAHVLSEVGKSPTVLLAEEPGFEELEKALRKENGRRVAVEKKWKTNSGGGASGAEP